MRQSPKSQARGTAIQSWAVQLVEEQREGRCLLKKLSGTTAMRGWPAVKLNAGSSGHDFSRPP